MLSYKPDGCIVDDFLNKRINIAVNPVNTVGVMGNGLAKKFADLFPEMVDEYKTRCECKMIDVMGQTHWAIVSDGQSIFNLPTKDHYKDKSEIKYILSGLTALRVRLIKHGRMNPDSKSIIGVPMLGCGLGGLKWNKVHNWIPYYLDGIDNVDVVIYGKEVK